MQEGGKTIQGKSPVAEFILQMGIINTKTHVIQHFLQCRARQEPKDLTFGRLSETLDCHAFKPHIYFV